MSNDHWRITLFFCIASLVTIHSQSALAAFFERLLPVWPLNNIGEPIPDNLIKMWRAKGDLCPGLKGEFSAFPSKGNKDPNSPVDSKQPNGPKIKDTKNYKLDHSFICDDGDQTTYIGLLCASGDASACQSIAQSQDEKGRFYRSPHRRWMWEHRCFDKRDPLDENAKNPILFNDHCANGFSPDMNLGVLLYTLKTRDLRRYSNWLKWLNSNAATTKLCKLDDKNNVIDGTCERVEWPRVCPEDLGHLNPGESPGFAINGKYGGVCALRPWDALDFAAVNEATSIAPPSRMSNWEVNSRAIILASKEILRGAVTGVPVIGLPAASIAEVPPLIIMSSVDGTYYPLHLDAIRVLIRMMIRNPSLQLNSLPDMPNPSDLPGLLGIAASDATDPTSINVAAGIISGRASWNPFYKLLSDGPTPEVRSSILNRCPTESDNIDKNDWNWEKSTKLRDDGTADNDKHHSMGWDCVFVGNLYNKMRVNKPILDELFALFLKYADVLGNSLKQLSQTLQLAQAANALAQKTLDEAQKSLSSAQDFVSKEYAEQKKAALNRVNELTAQLNQLAQQQANLEKQAVDLRNSAMNLPDRVITQVTKRVCEKLPWPANELCKNVTKPVEVVNQQKHNILGQVSSIEKQIVVLKGQTIAAAQAKLVEANAVVAKLDDQLQAAHNNLQKNILQTAVSVARADFALKGHLFGRKNPNALHNLPISLRAQVEYAGAQGFVLHRWPAFLKTNTNLDQTRERAMIELTRRKMLSVTAAAVVGALASARATRPARANYINEINLQRIRNDPSFFKELWDTTYSVRESLGFDLGKEFLALNDHGYLAAFACVTAYDLTSYGNEPRIGPDYTLKELLAAPHLACDLYCVVTALLFRQVRPKSPERFWMAGWDHGAVGNHAQLFVEGVGLPLMLDPTIGAVAIADYNDVKAGRPVAPDKYRRLSSRKNEPFGDFPNKVKSAVEHGLYRPSDYLYFQDAEKYGRN